jgi:hypothetical protein
MIINGTSGDGDIGEAYVKYTNGPQPNLGTVYVVQGNSSENNGGGPQSTFSHPLIYRGDTCGTCFGSLLVDINGDRLDGYYLSAYDSIKDHFTILKQAYTGIDEKENALDNFSVAPNPLHESAMVSYSLSKRSPVQIEVFDMTQKSVLKLSLPAHEPGKYNEEINLKGLPAATYLVRFDAESLVKYKRIVKAE